MEYYNILVSHEGPVTWITLNRTAIHNAFDEMMIAELSDAYTLASRDPKCRAIVLGAAGSSFCGGADLAWMGRLVHYSREENLQDARKMHEMFEAIANCPKVTVAVVQGAAMGGGVGLIAACDVAVASTLATFGLSEVKLGLAPATIAPYILQKIGVGAARALFVTGERFDAATALRLGLIHKLVPPEELERAVLGTVKLALSAGPNAVSACKALLRDIDGKSAAQAAEETIRCIACLRVGTEGQEGISAFLEKRKPAYAV